MNQNIKKSYHMSLCLTDVLFISRKPTSRKCNLILQTTSSFDKYVMIKYDMDVSGADEKMSPVL